MIMRHAFFSVRQEVDLTIVTLSDDVGDNLLAEDLTYQLAAFVDDMGPVTLVIDFVDVQSCPSAAIAALIAAQRQLQALGGRLKLAIPSDRIRVVFQRLNLNLLFEIYHSREEAIRACRAESHE